MRSILFFVFILFSLTAQSANRFWVGGGSSTNWSATGNTNWSATSGGSNNASVPGAADDVFFDGVGASANGASVVAGSLTILSLTISSGYTNNIQTGTLTIAGNFTDNTAHTWSSSGTITISAAATIASGGKTYPGSITFANAGTRTLSADWTVTGIVTCSGGTVTLNGFQMNIGGMTLSNTCSGTTIINFASTGTWQGASALSNPVTITEAGTLSISGSVLYGGTSFTYVSGTVSAGSSTVTLSNAAPTLSTNGMSFANLTLNAAMTLTTNSLLSVSAILTINSAFAVTFAGTAGFTAATFTLSHVSSATITLTQGNTYTITTAFNALTARTGSIVTVISSHATNKVTLTLNNNATCNVMANLTRIDASGGRTINTWNGVVTTCTNVQSFTDLKTVTSGG